MSTMNKINNDIIKCKQHSDTSIIISSTTKAASSTIPKSTIVDIVKDKELKCPFNNNINDMIANNKDIYAIKNLHIEQNMNNNNNNNNNSQCPFNHNSNNNSKHEENKQDDKDSNNDDDKRKALLLKNKQSINIAFALDVKIPKCILHDLLHSTPLTLSATSSSSSLIIMEEDEVEVEVNNMKLECPFSKNSNNNNTNNNTKQHKELKEYIYNQYKDIILSSMKLTILNDNNINNNNDEKFDDQQQKQNEDNKYRQTIYNNDNSSNSNPMSISMNNNSFSELRNASRHSNCDNYEPHSNSDIKRSIQIQNQNYDTSNQHSDNNNNNNNNSSNDSNDSKYSNNDIINNDNKHITNCNNNNDNINNKRISQTLLKKRLELLDRVAEVQRQYLESKGPKVVYGALLQGILDLLNCEYGFISEVKYEIDKTNSNNSSIMYLHSHATTTNSSNSDSINYFNNYAAGLKFYNFDTLFGYALLTKQPIISNNPSTDSRKGRGCPAGHPPLSNFLGIPFFRKNGDVMGMIAIANKNGGFNDTDIEFLEPFTVTAANLVQAYFQIEANEHLINTLELKVKERTHKLEGAIDDLALANVKVMDASAAQLKHFACMSHEIRTPLNCIIGLSSLLLENSINSSEITDTDSITNSTNYSDDYNNSSINNTGIESIVECNDTTIIKKTNNNTNNKKHPNYHNNNKLSPSQEEAMQMIVTSGDLLLTVVNDVLDYSKLQSGNAEIDIQRSNLQETLSGIVHSIEMKGLIKNIKIKTYYDISLPEYLTTDSRRLQQILYNLLGNALKFGPDNSVIDVTVELIHKKKSIQSDKEHKENNDNTINEVATLKDSSSTSELTSLLKRCDSDYSLKEAKELALSLNEYTNSNSCARLAAAKIRNETKQKNRKNRIKKHLKNSSSCNDLNTLLLIIPPEITTTTTTNTLIDSQSLPKVLASSTNNRYTESNNVNGSVDMNSTDISQSEYDYDDVAMSQYGDKVEKNMKHTDEYIKDEENNELIVSGKCKRRSSSYTPISNDHYPTTDTILRLKVKDYGVGIARKDFDRIFEPFSQAKAETERVFGGTGLGLAITLRLVQALNGKISVDSEEGLWSEFTVDLPFQDQPIRTKEITESFINTQLIIVDKNYELNETQEHMSNILLQYDVSNVSYFHSIHEFDSYITTKQQLHQHFDSSSSSSSSKSNNTDNTYICLMHEDQFNRTSFRTLKDKSSNPIVLFTYGPQFLVNESKFHFRKLNQVLPSVLMKTLVTSIQNRSTRDLVSNTEHQEDNDGRKRSQRKSITNSSSNTNNEASARNNHLYIDLRILIAEDNKINQKVLCRILQRMNIKHIDVVDNGKQAVEQESIKEYDLILMDMQMPVMDGVEATKMITSTEKQRNHLLPKIVFVTAHVAPSFEQECINAGGVAFLAKPFSVHDIETLIHRLFVQKQSTISSTSSLSAPTTSEATSTMEQFSSDIFIANEDDVDHSEQIVGITTSCSSNMQDDSGSKNGLLF